MWKNKFWKCQILMDLYFLSPVLYICGCTFISQMTLKPILLTDNLKVQSFYKPSYGTFEEWTIHSAINHLMRVKEFTIIWDD